MGWALAAEGYKYSRVARDVRHDNAVLQNDIHAELGRNYQNFQSLLTDFLEGISIGKKGAEISVYEFWGYGCYCLPASGMPLSGGYGEPVDSIDRICFNRKRCIGCLDINYPDASCDPETVRYRYDVKTDKNGEIVGKCTNRPNTCPRSVCECDLRLAKEIRTTLLADEKSYDMKYNLFTGKFDRDNLCQKRHNGGAAPDQCCDDGTGYMLSFSSFTHECCPNGSGGNTIRMIGNC